MTWNWQLNNWPHFYYESAALVTSERKFLQGVGGVTAILNQMAKEERVHFIIELLSTEGLKSSQIEGEVLQRESLQSSIRRHFGLQSKLNKTAYREKGIADLLCLIYETYNQPLTHEMLHEWHRLLMQQHSEIENLGCYRTHDEPMQIVSRRYGDPNVHFEAPPSRFIQQEMDQFITWFNNPEQNQLILGRAAQAHVYFESIHPFEDGNGRIGRAIVEKLLSQALGHPTLIAVSQVIERRKKEYYQYLAECNRSLQIDRWAVFFAEAILQAQQISIQQIEFMIYKAKLMNSLTGKINARQEKALLRMFEEGPEGFAGGLSAENYIAITKASKATATRDLADLVAKSALIRTGELRHTRYWLQLIKSS